MKTKDYYNVTLLIFIIFSLSFSIISCSNKNKIISHENNNITTRENDTVPDIFIAGLDEIGDTIYSLHIDLKYDSVFYSSTEKFVHYNFEDKQYNELNYILQKNTWNKLDNTESWNFDNSEKYGLVNQNVIVAYFNKSGSEMLIRINNIYDGTITECYSVPIDTYSDIEKFILKYSL